MTTKPANLFENLWRQLGECHQNALEEWEAKVKQLKKDRCLDAQRLEVFHNRNQQLKEQNKKLQDVIGNLEGLLQTGVCDQCAILEDNLKNSQDKNLHIITKLKSEREFLKVENRKLLGELQKFKMSLSDSQSDQEDGIIPDSPILQSSLPVANKLKKRKRRDKTKHFRYAEKPLPRCNNSIFSELDRWKSNPGRAEVLVPNTCQLDISQIPDDVVVNVEDPIAETCGLELFVQHPMKSRQEGSSPSSSKTAVVLKSTLIHSSYSPTERSQSLLPPIKGFPGSGSPCRTKRKKEESSAKEKDKESLNGKKEQMQQELREPTEECVNTEPLDCQILRSDASYASPVFKKPNRKPEPGLTGKDGNSSKHQHTEEHTEKKLQVEATWSVDPALALSQYEQEEEDGGELQDTDCTWVSHSLLQRRGGGGGEGEERTGLGRKANDSLDLMFETSAYGEYKSLTSSHLGEEEEEEEEEKRAHPLDSSEHSMQRRKAGRPDFAHVAVVRKKEERRKLKGTTCKECDTYYADLPEEERQKKLAACSRHRFLYIPPSTPENFWEVGFPSTQTCMERGYIHEETNPQSRLRRRQPLSALFSPGSRQREGEDISP